LGELDEVSPLISWVGARQGKKWTPWLWKKSHRGCQKILHICTKNPKALLSM